MGMSRTVTRDKIRADAYYQPKHVRYTGRYCHLVDGRIRSARFTLDLSDIAVGVVTITRAGKHPASYTCRDSSLSREESIANAMNTLLQEQKDTAAMKRADKLGYVIDTLPSGRVEASYVTDYSHTVRAYGDTVAEATNKLSAIL